MHVCMIMSMCLYSAVSYGNYSSDSTLVIIGICSIEAIEIKGKTVTLNAIMY